MRFRVRRVGYMRLLRVHEIWSFVCLWMAVGYMKLRIRCVCVCVGWRGGGEYEISN